MKLDVAVYQALLIQLWYVRVLEKRLSCHKLSSRLKTFLLQSAKQLTKIHTLMFLSVKFGWKCEQYRCILIFRSTVCNFESTKYSVQNHFTSAKNLIHFWHFTIWQKWSWHFDHMAIWSHRKRAIPELSERKQDSQLKWIFFRKVHDWYEGFCSEMKFESLPAQFIPWQVLYS